MTRQRAIDILSNELKCIERNDGVNCDRKCESCDLVMDADEIKDAYNFAIKILEQEDEPIKNFGQLASMATANALKKIREDDKYRFKNPFFAHFDPDDWLESMH